MAERGLMNEELILLERLIRCAPLPGALPKQKQEGWDKALVWQRQKADDAVLRWVMELERTGNKIE